MSGARAAYRRTLERWSPRLFLAAGAVLVGYAALNGLWAFGELTTRDSGVQFGYVLGFLGLLGICSALADRRPWLARIGAVGAASGIVGITAIATFEVGQLAGFWSGPPPGWWGFVFLTLAGFVVGYLAVGIAVLRADRYPTPAGLLLLVPGVIVVLMLAHIAAGWASDVTAFVISAGEAMAHLAIGETLRRTADRSAPDAPAADATVEAHTDD